MSLRVRLVFHQCWASYNDPKLYHLQNNHERLMRDDHHMHIMSTSSLLDRTPNPLCYNYFLCDQHSGTLYQNKAHPFKTLSGTLFPYTNWSRIIAECLEGRRGSWQVSVWLSVLYLSSEGFGYFPSYSWLI